MTWDAIFVSGRRWNKYPPEELIRFCTPLDKGRVFDFGCGPGAGTSWYLAREGWNYMGWDTSDTAIEETRKRFQQDGLHGHFGPTEQLENATVDLFVDVCVLQHVEQAANVILEARRILKPGGRIFSMWVTDASSDAPYAEFGYTNYASHTKVRDLFAALNPEIELSSRSTKGRMISHHVIMGTKA